MSDRMHAQVAALLAQAEDLPASPAKVALLEEAIRLADTYQEAALGFWLRKKMVEAAQFSGMPEKALVAFTWRLAQCDRNPEEFDVSSLLWEYKWMAHDLVRFPQIARAQIEDMLEDMARRYTQQGASLRPIHKLRWLLAMDMHEPTAARKHYAIWEQTPRSWPSDCVACDQDDSVAYHRWLGKDEEALTLARPILEGGLRCAEVPHVTLARVLLPLVRLGRLQEAMRYHHRGYRMIRSGHDFLSQVGDHLTFLALTDNLVRAVKLLEKHLDWALQIANQQARFAFFKAVCFLLQRFETGGKENLRLRLPRDFPRWSEDGRYRVADLRTWVEQTAAQLAQQFDERNGNCGFSEELHGLAKLHELVTPWPLRSPRSESEE